MNSFLTYHPALWAPLLQLEEGNGDSPFDSNLYEMRETFFANLFEFPVD